MGEVIEVRENVVWRQGGYGIKIVGAVGANVTVEQNTSCFNGGAGLVWDGVPSQRADWKSNIGLGNRGHGISWLTADGGAAVGCNDWFGNEAGDVGGQPPSGADFSVDPMFCDAVGGDFRLNSDSPLLDWPGCALVGALGMGCGETATLVRRFTAGHVADGIRVVWEVAEGATASAIWVERAEGMNGEAWSEPVTERSTEGRAVVELDRGALPDRAYRYRLVALDGGNVTVVDPGILVEAQARLAFGLVEVGPSPGGVPVRIGFSLAHASRIEIDVFDVQGRRVASPGSGAWPAGTHAVVWDGRARSGQSAPAGLYVVRYRFPGGQDRRHIVRVQ